MIADLAMQRALDRYHQVGVSGLSAQEKTLAALWCFDAKVANGGLEHFYDSKEGELAEFVPTAFHNIGAGKLANIAGAANAVFGPGGVPLDQSARRKAAAALPADARQTFDTLEAAYADDDTEFDALVEAYLAQGRQPQP